MKSQIFAVLTPDQRTKAEEMKKNFEEREGRRGRWRHDKGAAAGQQPGAPAEF